MDKIQVIKCKCGKIFSACREPECYTDDFWHNELKTYLNQGCTADTIPMEDFKFEKCVCEPIKIN